jgi:long-subunit acyl-CoA synthetase (AMP-forming)
MGIQLQNSPDGNLTIDDRRNGLWQSWEGKGVAAEPIEDSLHKLIRKNT